ncbi:methyltransferase domain-containing protein [Micromonospora sp. KC207]|uniref:methyltransferase domain-containing protein n=1 Tax=Micromonospora sp. KC207 TaxID=2530377 RepID=UPI00104912BA|nr:methyltransferase domain-containing protein [Micromonospora sp. KC207]TDC47594.1 methyltransferase domain-containing protein [Micromonospora sp. KC207]
MGTTGSYDVSRIGASVDAEIDRLGGQVELFWAKESQRYAGYGLTAGLTVVELGCGPGYLLEKLATAFPGLDLHGLELDPLLVERATRYLSEQGLDVSVRQGSILDTGYPEATFDFAVIRLVLEHLPEPMTAIREVYRILRPGGRAVFVDNDFEMHLMSFPPIPELREVYDAYCRSREDEGGNPRIGRELPVLLAAGGFVDVDYDVISAHSALVGDDLFARSEGVGIPSRLVRDGYLSSRTLGLVSSRWRDLLRGDGHALIRQLHLGTGRRPAADR